jgi:quercetin dioxygenase-like cupin family protein
MHHAADPARGLERRSFLGAAAAALGATALGDRHLSPLLRGPETRLTFPEFVRAFGPVAKELVGDTSRLGEDRYLHTLASYAVRLVDVPVPEMRQTSKGDGPRNFMGVNDGGEDDPFVVLHWRLEPGARIGLHPHIYGNVVTLGLEGEARIQNYETVGAPDFDRRDPFQVRKIHEQILRPGEINVVPLSHGYVHGFVAGPAGARGLDITTRIRPKRPTPSLEVSPKAIDAARGVYEGTWRYEEKK